MPSPPPAVPSPAHHLSFPFSTPGYVGPMEPLVRAAASAAVAALPLPLVFYPPPWGGNGAAAAAAPTRTIPPPVVPQSLATVSPTPSLPTSHSAPATATAVASPPLSAASSSVASYGRVSLSLAPRPTKPANAASVTRREGGWRDLVSFPVPVRVPELMCHDPQWMHSATLRLTCDRGVRYVHPIEAEETLGLHLDRGVIGVSLAKHSRAFLQSRASTYPGIQQRIAQGGAATTAVLC